MVDISNRSRMHEFGFLQFAEDWNNYRYSNTLGWNTFPMPKLTQKNIEDLKKILKIY